VGLLFNRGHHTGGNLWLINIILIYGLFYDAVNTRLSLIVLPKDNTVRKQLAIKYGKERSWHDLMHCPSTSLQELTKTTKHARVAGVRVGI
jgi:hypothetical protein